jgi:hypothetical protein
VAHYRPLNGGERMLVYVRLGDWDMEGKEKSGVNHRVRSLCTYVDIFKDMIEE